MDWRKDHNPADFLADSKWGLPQESSGTVAAILNNNEVTEVWQLRDMMAGKNKDEVFTRSITELYPDQYKMLNMIDCLWDDILDELDVEGSLDMLRILNQAGKKLGEDVSQERGFSTRSIAVKAPIQLGRIDDIRIVLGPSGSGKTVYAINKLAHEKKENEKVVCVYYSLSDINPGDYEGDKDSPATHPFVEHVKKTLVEALKEGSRNKWKGEEDTDGRGKNKLKLKVSLILDEVGTMSDLLGRKPILTQIFNNIKSYATDARLILAGTGFDKISSGLSSSSDVYKYRMQPWDTAHLNAAATKRYPDNGRQYVQAIGAYPVLKSLITNARAAMFTLDAVMRLKKGYHTINLKGSIGAVVQLVIGEYIAHNGIGGLTDMQRKKMAYAVFHEIKLQNESTGARFPELTMLKEGGEDTKIRRQAYGVLDVHVETSNVDGKVVACFVDGKYQERRESVSITPAMSMLLYILLGVETSIYDTWEGLEATAALHAVYLEVIDNPKTKTAGVRVARLTKPVPEAAATKNILVPAKEATPTIFINGDKAPFFDVIAIPRGLQAKYSKHRESVDLYLGEELQKCGLLTERLSEEFLPPEPVEEPAPKANSSAASKSNSSAKKRPADGNQDEPPKKRVKKKASANKEATEATEATDEGKLTKAQEKSQKAFAMGNATMASFLHVWKPKTNAETKTKTKTTGRRIRRLEPGVETDDYPPFQSPAFYFPKASRAEKVVVPSLRFQVDGDSVTFQNTEIDKVSFESTKPFNMIFITNGSKFRLLPKQNDQGIVITPHCVDVNGDLKKKSDAYVSYLKALNPKENVNIRFVFTGNESFGANLCRLACFR